MYGVVYVGCIANEEQDSKHENGDGYLPLCLRVGGSVRPLLENGPYLNSHAENDYTRGN